MSYAHLKSGTDIRGTASDIFGESITLTDEAIFDIASAFVCFIIDRFKINAEELTISVGHDSRITSESISKKITDALVCSGVSVINCGLSSTPAMFMTTVKLSCNAAIQVTASHHPADKNGLKFFLPSGGLEGDDISKILSLADSKFAYKPNKKGNVTSVDFMSSYSAMLREKICNAVGISEADKPLSGYKIIVDAGNGVGGFYAKDVLERLGADISGSQFLNPDGMFPNHIPNPENHNAMNSICSAVIKNKADFGIIFDTDVDRAGCVDRMGNEVNRNRLIALAAMIVAKEPGATIVTDSVTSDGIKEFIEDKLQCKHFRYKRGYKNVIDKAIELCKNGIYAPLAIETSGHAALKENYFLDDGAYLITKIIIEIASGRDIVDMLSELKNPEEEYEYRFKINDENFRSYGQNVVEQLKSFAKEQKDWKLADENYEGLRYSTPEGWFLLRLSVHDPVMPINIESSVKGGVEKIKIALTPFFKRFDKLDMNGYIDELSN